ncbi:hypothetical protein J6TS2_27120 [Heyndrickxia sporothermodurans]|nr:hypothetical protein J6TS2_27120 [Heyndrickxia sporothermodurans]
MLNDWLTNELRPLLGLQEIENDWDYLALSEGDFLLFDQDIIRKRITISSTFYKEEDVEIETRDRKWVLPKTKRGKEKKLNFTSISQRMKQGISFQAGFYSHDEKSFVTVYNAKNAHFLPFRLEHFKTVEEIKQWLQKFPENLPKNYEVKLERFLHAKRKRQKVIAGDVFRIDRSFSTYGYVLVIGNLREMEKDGIFPSKCIWKNVMTMPLFIRVYDIETEENLTLEQLKKIPLKKGCQIVMDDDFMRGVHEKIGTKKLKATEVEFPMGYGQMGDQYCFSWGAGTVVKSKKDVAFRSGSCYLNHGVYASVLWGEREYMNTETLQMVWKEFDFENLMDFDIFNQHYEGQTVKEYLTYVEGKE